VAERDLVHDDRREQMLRAAIDVIAERGFPDTRISDVGKRVGASSALVIYYFGTKDRLLTEALRHSEDLFYAEVGRRLDVVDGAWDKLEALVRLCCCESVEGLPGSWLLWPDLWAQAARHPEVSRDREELDQRWRDRVADIVREGEDSGEFTPLDVDEFALIFTAATLVIGYLAYRVVKDRKGAPDPVDALVGTGVGRCCLAVGLGLEGLAALWIRRIVASTERAG
jgi:AcrR family transcriptional regulator